MDFWDFKRPRARFTISPLTGMVDIDYPQQGLSDLRLNGASLAGLQPLAVVLPGKPSTGHEAILEAYSRGNDLVATYAQSPGGRSVRPQLYWRAVSMPTSGGPAVGVELIFSMQTSLLESVPQASIESQLPAGSLWRQLGADETRFGEVTQGEARPEEGSGLFLFQPAAGDWSFVTMIDPSDFVAASLSAGHAAGDAQGTATKGHALRYELFPDSLEKGVIRRARMRVGLLPGYREQAQALAAECYGQFTAEPLPLST